MRLLVCLAATLAAAASAQDVGLRVIGQLDPRPQNYADVWGYVAPDGREYALVNTRQGAGLSIFDVTTMPPVEVAFVPGNVSTGIGSDVEVYRHYAYVSDDRSPVQIVDLTNPAQPVLAATFEPDPGQFTAGVHTLTIADGYLYTQGGGAPGGVRIFSLADPLAPAFVGEYQPHYVHDILVRGDTMYTMGILGQGVDIVDLADRRQPRLIARFNYPGSGVHNACGTDDGYLFVGDEIGSSGRWTRVFDVRDPQNVELVAEIVVNPAAVVHNCHLVGDRLYLGHYTAGVRVWDVSDRRRPVEVASYNSGMASIWSVYPHLPSGKLLASDQPNGLWVLAENSTVGAPPAPTAAAPALQLAPSPTTGPADALLTLTAPADVRVTVHDVLGRTVGTVEAGALAAGAQRVALPTAGLPPGVYVVRATAGATRVGARTLTVVR